MLPELGTNVIAVMLIVSPVAALPEISSLPIFVIVMFINELILFVFGITVGNVTELVSNEIEVVS